MAKQRGHERGVEGEVGVCRFESEAWTEVIYNVNTAGWKVEEAAVGERRRKKLGSGVNSADSCKVCLKSNLNFQSP